jgi:hypothetical protein
MINKLNKKIVRLIYFLFAIIVIGLSFFSNRQDNVFLILLFVFFTLLNLSGFEYYYQKSQSLSEFNISLSIFIIGLTKYVFSISLTLLFLFSPSFPWFVYTFIELILFTIAYISILMLNISQEVIKNQSNTFYLSLQEKVLHLDYDSSTIDAFKKLKKKINSISKKSSIEASSVEQEILDRIEVISEKKISNEAIEMLDELLLQREKIIEKKRD